MTKTIYVVTFDPLAMGVGGIGGFDWFLAQEDAGKAYHVLLQHQDSHLQLWEREIPADVHCTAITDWLCDNGNGPADGKLLMDSHPHTSATFRDATIEFESACKAYTAALTEELRRLVHLHQPTATHVEVTYEVPELGLGPCVGFLHLLDEAGEVLDIEGEVAFAIEGLLAGLFQLDHTEEAALVSYALDPEV